MGLILLSIHQRYNLQTDTCSQSHLDNLGSLPRKVFLQQLLSRESNKVSSLAFDYRRQSVIAQYVAGLYCINLCLLVNELLTRGSRAEQDPVQSHSLVIPPTGDQGWELPLPTHLPILDRGRDSPQGG